MICHNNRFRVKKISEHDLAAFFVLFYLSIINEDNLKLRFRAQIFFTEDEQSAGNFPLLGNS